MNISKISLNISKILISISKISFLVKLQAYVSSIFSHYFFPLIFSDLVAEMTECTIFVAMLASVAAMELGPEHKLL